MDKRFSPKRISEIRSQYKDDLFFKIASSVCVRYTPDMRHFNMSAEEFYIECLQIIHDILEEERNYSSVFYQKIQEYRRLEPSVDEQEIRIVAVLLFLCVIWALGSSRRFHYSNELPEKLMIVVMDQSREEWDKLSDSFFDSMERYEDDLRGWLDDVIIDAPKEKKADEKSNANKAFIPKDYAFKYSCADEKAMKRLTNFYLALKQIKLIDDDCDQQKFVDLFSGVKGYDRFKWTGGKEALAYIFKQLINELKYVQLDGGRIWDTVRSHFVQPDSNLWGDDLRSQKTPSDKVKSFLDLIIGLLNPALDPSKPMSNMD